MNRKVSKTGIIKKIVHAVSAVAGPILAVFDWLVRHTSKTHKKGGAHQTVAEKGKEKSGMLGIVLKICAVIGVIAVVGIIADTLFGWVEKMKRWFAGKEEPMVNLTEPQPPKVQPLSVASYQALYARKRELEQKMVGVTGGETGLFTLREMIHDAVGEGRPDISYREAYRMKQGKLRGYMKDYRELLKQAEGAPEEEKRRFAPKEGLERYQELLDEKV